MANDAPLAVGRLAPRGTSRCAILILSANRTDLVCHRACHEIDDDRSDILELVSIESVEWWFQGVLQLGRVLEGEYLHLGEDNVRFRVAQLLHGGRGVGGRKGRPQSTLFVKEILADTIVH